MAVSHRVRKTAGAAIVICMSAIQRLISFSFSSRPGKRDKPHIRQTAFTVLTFSTLDDLDATLPPPTVTQSVWPRVLRLPAPTRRPRDTGVEPGSGHIYTLQRGASLHNLLDAATRL